MVSTFLTILLILNALVLIVLVVILQQGGDGGLGGAFGGGNSSGFFGASGGVKTIIRVTWFFGLSFFLLSLATSWNHTHEKYETKNHLERALSAPTPNVQK